MIEKSPMTLAPPLRVIAEEIFSIAAKHFKAYPGFSYHPVYIDQGAIDPAVAVLERAIANTPTSAPPDEMRAMVEALKEARAYVNANAGGPIDVALLARIDAALTGDGK